MTLDDREYNFTIPANQASGLRIPEHAIRQLIGYGLRQIRANVDTLHGNVIDSLFARLPLELRNDIKAWLRDRPNLVVNVNWPKDDASLPLMAVVNTSCAEDESSTLLGDYGGLHVLGQNAIEVRRIPDRNISTVYVATDDPNLTMYLSYLVRFIILSNKDDLTRWYDMHNLVVGMQDIQWNEQFLPTFCYIRAIQLQYQTYFDFAVESDVINVVSLSVAVTADTTGVSVQSEVAIP